MLMQQIIDTRLHLSFWILIENQRHRSLAQQLGVQRTGFMPDPHRGCPGPIQGRLNAN